MSVCISPYLLPSYAAVEELVVGAVAMVFGQHCDGSVDGEPCLGQQGYRVVELSRHLLLSLTHTERYGDIGACEHHSLCSGVLNVERNVSSQHTTWPVREAL